MIYLSQSDGHTNRYGDATDIEYSSSIAGWTAMDNADRGQHHQQQEQAEQAEHAGRAEQSEQKELYLIQGCLNLIWGLNSSLQSWF